MKLPRIGSASDTIVSTIFEHGSMTAVAVIQIHGILRRNARETAGLYINCVDLGWLTESNGVYSLMPSLHAIFKLRSKPITKSEELVPSRTRTFLTPELRGYEASIRRMMRVC